MMKMLQHIEPYKFHNEYYKREIKETDYYAYIKDGKIAVIENDDGIILPSVLNIGIKHSRFLFCIDDIGIYELLEETDDIFFWNSRDKREFIIPWMKFASLEAIRISKWYNDNRYCGKCGNLLEHSVNERALICPKCRNTIYPRINPVAIVGIINDNRILLTRYANHSVNHYALIAGFAEFGETIEQTIEREVKEEVGLKVKNIKYVTSQSWPMSESLIFGFYAELDGNEAVCFNDNELDKAIWLKPEEIEYIEAFSLTTYLINNFKEKGRKVLE